MCTTGVSPMRHSKLLQQFLLYTCGLGLVLHVTIGLLSPVPAHGQEFDQNTALELTRTGTILPLSAVVERLHLQHDMQSLKLLEATLHTSAPHPVYLLELLDTDHHVQDLCVDATTTAILPLATCHVADNPPDAD